MAGEETGICVRSLTYFPLLMRNIHVNTFLQDVKDNENDRLNEVHNIAMSYVSLCEFLF